MISTWGVTSSLYDYHFQSQAVPAKATTKYARFILHLRSSLTSEKCQVLLSSVVISASSWVRSSQHILRYSENECQNLHFNKLGLKESWMTHINFENIRKLSINCSVSVSVDMCKSGSALSRQTLEGSRCRYKHFVMNKSIYLQNVCCADFCKNNICRLCSNKFVMQLFNLQEGIKLIYTGG